jgi:hypothetical protein
MGFDPPPQTKFNTMADISRDCFTDLTPDNQLYEILQALGSSSSAGIASINGDTTAAQLIAGSSPLSAATAAGTTTISSTQAGATTAGYLSSTDWNTFNNKQPALGFTAVPNTRTISTTSPITGGGDLSADRTIAMPAATASVSGHLTSTDWNTFNSKVNRSGDTMTGKLNLPNPTATESGLNIGQGTAPASPIDGDVYIVGNQLFYKTTGAAARRVAVSNQTNNFGQPQIIETPVTTTTPALRVTQLGTGEALRVEDETTPDATAFVISNSGRVGVGVTPDATVSLSLDNTGLKFGDGTVQTTAAPTADLKYGPGIILQNHNQIFQNSGYQPNSGGGMTDGDFPANGSLIGGWGFFPIGNANFVVNPVDIFGPNAQYRVRAVIRQTSAFNDGLHCVVRRVVIGTGESTVPGLRDFHGATGSGATGSGVIEIHSRLSDIITTGSTGAWEYYLVYFAAYNGGNGAFPQDCTITLEQV